MIADLEDRTRSRQPRGSSRLVPGWLARSRGAMQPRLGPVPRPLARLPGAGRGREPARADGPAPRGARRPGPAVLALDRSARGRPAAPPVRDVARGAGAGPRGTAREGARRALADLLDRAAGDRRAGRRPGAAASATWRSGRSSGRAALAELAAGRCSSWPTRSCPTRRPRRGSSSALRRRPEQRIHVVPNGVSPRFAGASPELFRAAHGAGRLRALRRPDRAAEERPRADPGGRGRRACRWWSSATPPPGHEAYAADLPAAGGDCGPLARRDRSRRPAARLGLRGGPGLRAAELVRDAGPGGARGGPGGRGGGDHALGCTREYFGDRVEYARPDRPAELRRAIERAWHDGPDPRLATACRERTILWSNVARRTAEVYDQVAG